MNIISWNIRGLNKPHKQDILKNMIRDNRPDIMVIQETKMLKDKVESLHLFKNGKILGNDSLGASGGLAVFWASRWIQGEIISQNSNFMNIRFNNSKDNFSWILTNVYAPNTKWGRKALWQEISDQRKLFENENWMVIGDFNTPLKDNEKWGGKPDSAR